MGGQQSSHVMAAARRAQRLEQIKIKREMQSNADSVRRRGDELAQQVMDAVRAGDQAGVRILALQLARNQALQARIAGAMAQFETFASQVQEIELSQRVADTINVMTQRMVAYSMHSSLATTHAAMRNFALESHDMQLRSGMMEAALNSQQAEGEMDAHQDATSIANRVLEQLGAEMRLPDEPGSQLALASTAAAAGHFDANSAPLFADST